METDRTALVSANCPFSVRVVKVVVDDNGRWMRYWIVGDLASHA
jgi:hypothetical protein